jgi:hypothetical protein
VLGEALHVLRSAHDSNWPIVVTERELLLRHVGNVEECCAKTCYTLLGEYERRARRARVEWECGVWRADYACNPSSVSKNWQRARVSGCAV